MNRRPKKTLLSSAPLQKKKNIYESWLLFPAQASKVNHYLEGKHLSSIVLLQAAQEMNHAVIEKFLIDAKDRLRVRLISNNHKTIFHEFIYLFPTVMQCKILKTGRAISGDLAGESKVTFFQSGTKCLETFFCYGALDKKNMDMFENMSIQKRKL